MQFQCIFVGLGRLWMYGGDQTMHFCDAGARRKMAALVLCRVFLLKIDIGKVSNAKTMIFTVAGRGGKRPAGECIVFS